MQKTIRALVVEDNAEMRFMLVQMLRQLEADAVHTASSNVEALRLLEFGDYEFILIDVGLQQSNGIDLVHHVRSDFANRHRSTPILIVTGQNQLSVVKSAIDAGADSFVAKPVSLLTLGDHIDRILHHRRPLVEAPNYFGPERRRGLAPRYNGPERRQTASHEVELL